MQELTLESFLKYSRESLRDDEITKESQVVDYCSDGSGAYDFLQNIRKKFNINFAEFDYRRFFHTESEIIEIYRYLFTKKIRIIEPLTFEQLYEYLIHHQDYDEQGLTLDNLVKYIRNRDFLNHFDKNSNIIEWVGDGSDAYYFLKDLEKEFNVDLKDIDFTRYFHKDREFANNGCLLFWKKKKYRSVEALTASDLYIYMVKHQLPNNKND